MLDFDPWTQSDTNRLQRLSGGINALQEQAEDGELLPEEAERWALELNARRLPLMAKRKAAEEAEMQKQHQAILRQSAQVQSIQEANANSAAASAPFRMRTEVNPETGELERFLLQPGGKWEKQESQVLKASEAGGPKDAYAGAVAQGPSDPRRAAMDAFLASQGLNPLGSDQPDRASPPTADQPGAVEPTGDPGRLAPAPGGAYGEGKPGAGEGVAKGGPGPAGTPLAQAKSPTGHTLFIQNGSQAPTAHRYEQAGEGWRSTGTAPVTIPELRQMLQRGEISQQDYQQVAAGMARYVSSANEPMLRQSREQFAMGQGPNPDDPANAHLFSPHGLDANTHQSLWRQALVELGLPPNADVTKLRPNVLSAVQSRHNRLAIEHNQARVATARQQEAERKEQAVEEGKRETQFYGDIREEVRLLSTVWNANELNKLKPMPNFYEQARQAIQERWEADGRALPKALQEKRKAAGQTAAKEKPAGQPAEPPKVTNERPLPDVPSDAEDLASLLEEKQRREAAKAQGQGKAEWNKQWGGR